MAFNIRSELFTENLLSSYKVENLSFNPFPNKPWFLRVCSTSLLKTLWEKKKLLVTSNFSFSHSLYYLLGEISTIFNKYEMVVCQLKVWNLLFGKEMTFILKLANTCLLCQGCRARPSCTYVRSDHALHSLQLFIITPKIECFGLISLSVHQSVLQP